MCHGCDKRCCDTLANANLSNHQLMLVFIILTNILLLTSLIAILSQVFTKVRLPILLPRAPPSNSTEICGFVTVY